MCTTILVGKNASYDGSTIVARTEDSGSGTFEPKRFVVVKPGDHPEHYKSVLSDFEIDLPKNPMRYTAVPNANAHRGLWEESGINEANAAISATETITSNPRVLGADPLVASGIGEEDIPTLVLPYMTSARHGVELLGAILEQYGTYEMNAIAFQDVNEIWWMETVGGHHWYARRVPDDCYVTNPNQLGSDHLDFNDPDNFMWAADLPDFITRNHLNLAKDGHLNPRDLFGSHTDKDHHYNTPRAWWIQGKLTSGFDKGPMADDIPWANVADRLITMEDIKDCLSGHYQDTPYDDYDGNAPQAGIFRNIGINRTGMMVATQLRPNVPVAISGIQWLSYGSMPFNTMVPIYTQIESSPAYYDTTTTVDTHDFYWANRLIASMADAHFTDCQEAIESYQEATLSMGHAVLKATDAKVMKLETNLSLGPVLEAANQDLADQVQAATNDLLYDIVFTTGNLMKNAFHRGD